MAGTGLIGEIGGTTSLVGGRIDNEALNSGGDLSFDGTGSLLSISSLAIIGGVILAVVYMRQK